MSKISVLIVSDAVVVRRVLAGLLSADPALEVVGTAPNGRVALAKVPRVHPDLVLLDLDMPEGGGLETLTAVHDRHPGLPVLMLSRLGNRDEAPLLEALALGAGDYVRLPEGGVGPALHPCVREQLLPKVKLLGARRVAGGPGPVRRTLPAEVCAGPRPRVEVVAIGASTGGPNALSALIPALPADLPVPVVVVQHMPPVFTRRLADRLASQAALHVHEGASGDVLRAGHAWLAPGDYHMTLARGDGAVRILLHQGPPEHSCRPAVDVLLRSATEAYGAGTLAVVLTGMGQDGLRGCERVREAGGQVLAQDEESSVVWGMPGLVARAGLADQVLPLGQLAGEIVSRVRRDRSPSAHGTRPAGGGAYRDAARGNRREGSASRQGE